jgi:hypothetical protein
MKTPSKSDELEIKVQEINTPSRFMRGDFGAALSVLKRGGRVARKGWNGKNMWIFLVEGADARFDWIGDNYAHGVKGLEGPTKIRPYIVMKDAQGNLVPGWLASQTDMLAEDWVKV